MGGEVRRLRILHVAVQPILVWDDGDELAPGPGIDAVILPVSKLAGWAASLPAELTKLAEKLDSGE